MRPLTPALTVIALASALGLAGCGSNSSSSSDTSSSASSSSSSPSASSSETATSPSPSASDTESSAFTQLPGQQIADAAKQATTSASSLHLAGTITQNGEKESLDLQLDDQGECKGTLGIGGKGTAEILGVGGTYWFKPDNAFWHAYAGAAADKVIAVVGDRYVTNNDLGDVCDLSNFFDTAGSSNNNASTSVGDVQEVDGQETIAIIKTEKSGTSTGYVLTSSPHYLVKLERTGTEPGAFTFSDFDAPLDVTAPAAADQVDLSSLGG